MEARGRLGDAFVERRRQPRDARTEHAASQEPAQLVAVERCVPEDAAERAAFQLPV